MAKGSEAFAVSQYVQNVMASQTKRGLVFAMGGTALLGLPILRPFGSVISLIGVIWLVLGRDTFGKKHSRQAVRAAAIFFLGSAFVLVGSVAYLLFVLSISGPSFPLYWNGNDALAWALVQSLNSTLAIEVAGTILIGAALSLFVYYLQKPIERAVTLVGLIVNIGTSALIFSILSSDISATLLPDNPNLLSAYYPGNALPDVAHAFENHVLIVNLLNFIPIAVYISVYYVVYSRIKREHPFD